MNSKAVSKEAETMDEEQTQDLTELRETIKRLEAEVEQAARTVEEAHAIQQQILPAWDGSIPVPMELAAAIRKRDAAMHVCFELVRELRRAQKQLEKLEKLERDQVDPQREARQAQHLLRQGLALAPKRTRTTTHTERKHHG